MPQTRNPFDEGQRVKFRVHLDRSHQDYFGRIVDDYGGKNIVVEDETGKQFTINQMFVWPRQ